MTNEAIGRSKGFFLLITGIFAFLSLALSSPPATAASGQWGGVGGGGSGGASCNGYTAAWQVFGNKNANQPTSKPDGTPPTTAWNNFSNAASEWCGGYGYNDMPASLINGCKRSTFIWALITSEYNGAGGNGFLSNAKSQHNQTATVVKNEINAKGNGSNYYNGARNYIFGFIDTAYSQSGNYAVTLACSYAYDDCTAANCPTWGVQCNDLNLWDTKTHTAGAAGTDTYDTTTEAQLGCILRCPVANTSLANSNPKHWTRPARARSSGNATDGWVPETNGAGQSMNGNTATDDARRGDWCFNRPDDTQQVSRTKVTETDVPGQAYPYSWMTTAQDGTGVPHAGPTAWQAQPFGYVLTPYGELLDDAAANDSPPTDAQINNASNSIKSTPHSTLTLTDNNKKWLAEGGVITVMERTTYAYLSHYSRTSQPQVCTESRSWTFTYDRSEATTMTSSGWSGCGANSSNWTNNGTYTLTEDYYIPAQTPQNTAAYQVMANHCNANGFTAAAAADNGISHGNNSIANNDNLKNFSGSAITPVVRSSDIGGQDPSNYLTWGAAGRDPKGTDTVGFYDKECAYAGTNVASTPNNTLQTFFRDNSGDAFTVDLFKPQAGGVVHNDAGSALTTTVTRWLLGTPQVAQLNAGGTFTMWNAAGNSMFSTGKEVAANPNSSQQAAPVQKNWDTTTFISRNLSITSGETSTFRVGGTWSSDQGKPQVFTVRWEYAPTVDNTLATTLGFGANSTRSYNVSVVGVPIQGKVWAKFGASTSPAWSGVQAGYSGSGTTNGLDVPLYFGSDLNASNQWRQAPHTFSDYYTALRFVRATGD